MPVGVGVGDGNEVPQTSRGPYTIPDWLSPARVIALTQPSPVVVVCAPATVKQIAKPNPRRVGLYVIPSLEVQTEMRISPFTNPDLFGLSLTAAGGFLAITLADWLSLVCGAWYARSDSGASLLVCEVSRP